MLNSSTNAVRKWTKRDTIELALAYVATIIFISWFVEGIIKSIGWVGLIVPIGISIPIIILIVLIFRDSPTSESKETKPEQEPSFDYSKMGANDKIVQESSKE